MNKTPKEEQTMEEVLAAIRKTFAEDKNEAASDAGAGDDVTWEKSTSPDSK